MCIPFAAAIPSVFAAANATAGSALAAYGGASSAMSAMQMVSLAASVGGSLMSGMGAYNQASAAADVAKNNARIAEYQAKDAEKRGEKDVLDMRRKADQFKGQQRVKLAANGLDISYGSAADQLDATDFFAQQNEAIIRSNARKEAWALRAQKGQYQAEAASYSPWVPGSISLLTSAGQVAEKWYTTPKR